MTTLSRIFSILNKTSIILLIPICCLLVLSAEVRAQNPMSRFSSMGGGAKGGKGDTLLKHRNNLEDSITLNFRYLDSSRLRKMDSSVFDFYRKFPVPWHYIDLGNFGTASRDLVFSPNLQSGWDEGLHAYDAYMLRPEDTRFYNTTRPYAEMGYLIGGKAEQMININFTQNIKPNWNYAFQYRLINSPGTFNSQNTNHNNYRLNSWYQSRNKRYQSFLVVIANKLGSSENGGLKNFRDLDSSTLLRNNVPTELNNSQTSSNLNLFSSSIHTGTQYTTFTFLFRQQYDIIGKKDSIVTDSAVIPLFYPQFRAEHTIQYNTYQYKFFDQKPDTGYYHSHYGIIFPAPYIIQPGFSSDTFYKKDTWRQLVNDFSLYQFPDSKNPQQFIKAGVTMENFHGDFDSSSRAFYNLFIHGEYRNRTKNQKWDIEAYGKFYLGGYNAADYDASISLKRFLGKKVGYLQAGFQNADRTPSFVFTRSSSFSYGTDVYKKENNTRVFATLEQPLLDLKINFNYYLISNYTYFTAYSHQNQQSGLFNVLQVGAEKLIHLSRHWVWRASLELQQKAGPAAVNVPLLLTRDQIAYEGNLGLSNLHIAFGLDFRYWTGYKADGYDPLTGQFFTQNDTTIRLHLPDITPYVNFRIRGFTAFVRAENINTAQVRTSNGFNFGFTKYNFVAPGYPNTGLRIRVGIFWGFVN